MAWAGSTGTQQSRNTHSGAGDLAQGEFRVDKEPLLRGSSAGWSPGSNPELWGSGHKCHHHQLCLTPALDSAALHVGKGEMMFCGSYRVTCSQV